MNYKIIFPAVIFVTGLFLSCNELFERNLKKESVTILSPPDSFTTDIMTHTFWWEEVKGALEYRLHIVKGTFSYIQELVVDTVVTDDKITVTLIPGAYQWRVRAENSSSYTDWVIRTLTIDTTSDLSAQTLILTSPADNYVTNQTTQTLQWDTLYAAEDYRVQVAKPDFSSTANIIYDVTVITDSLNYTFTAEGAYQWRVRAQNSSSNTAYSTRTITIDTTAPIAPTLLFPLNGDTIPVPDTLKWNPVAAATGDTLYIYPDSLISAPVYKAWHTDTIYVFSGTSGEDYFWRLRSIDQAGNVSQYSVLRKFFIQ